MERKEKFIGILCNTVSRLTIIMAIGTAIGAFINPILSLMWDSIERKNNNFKR